MNTVLISPLTEHEHYQGLISAVIGGPDDPRLPHCYPYIIIDGERFFLVKEVNDILTDCLQKETLRLIYALDNEKKKKLAEVALGLGVAASKLRQNQQKGLRFLRQPSITRRLKRFLVPLPEELARREEIYRQLVKENQSLRQKREEIRKRLELRGIELDALEKEVSESFLKREQIVKADTEKLRQLMPHFIQQRKKRVWNVLRRTVEQGGLTLEQIKQMAKEGKAKGIIRGIGKESQKFLAENL